MYLSNWNCNSYVGSYDKLTLLFIILVDNGLQSSGMGGFILSIIPPVIALIIIGLYVNRENLDNLWHRSSTFELKTNSTDNRVTNIQNDDIMYGNREIDMMA